MVVKRIVSLHNFQMFEPIIENEGRKIVSLILSCFFSLQCFFKAITNAKREIFLLFQICGYPKCVVLERMTIKYFQMVILH